MRLIHHQYLPEVGVEGEGASSSQGISVPVSCRDTQSTPTVRSAKETQRSASGSMLRGSRGRAGEKHHRRHGLVKDCFPLCAGTAGPRNRQKGDFFFFISFLVQWHSGGIDLLWLHACKFEKCQQPSMDMVTRWHSPCCQCWVDQWGAAAEKYKIWLIYRTAVKVVKNILYI